LYEATCWRCVPAVRAGAESEARTIDAFLRALLDEHEFSRFWKSFAKVTPDSYATETASDGDDLEGRYSVEDRSLDATVV
jgi:hypothetical protein